MRFCDMISKLDFRANKENKKLQMQILKCITEPDSDAKILMKDIDERTDRLFKQIWELRLKSTYDIDKLEDIRNNIVKDFEKDLRDMGKKFNNSNVDKFIERRIQEVRVDLKGWI